MAALGVARRALLRVSPSSSVFSNRCLNATSPSSSVPIFARISRRRLPLNIARLPVELACAQSLMPYHSATASALLNSMLSSKSGNWGWLSEGFATPL
ncbi:protein NUCLEAR FUSION DEFECTIVE 6, mitochondrial-like [Dioscorea cayenensis subsp. rotundata]|uniref:Protein NUCLEAR FUSION DEFECTIVE 6, mitochondrial-like n=1 Tax=Dioscorea cayennensis subsp. rotundata TaxID=55577 RepID=A0AB40CYD7_DIOCR|nr:protein NUCLEAR FUSION DEFECTIVE 6, mitochondrial-like [Dioscorea cayenensis subsp. rotundata]